MMLKITTDAQSDPTTLKLEGKIAGEWVNELRRTWNELRRRKLGRAMIVDLSDVSFIDEEGKQLLALMFRQGAEFRSGPLLSMTRLILNRIEQEFGGTRESSLACAPQIGGI
jgi:hypothetical protein